MIIAGSCLYSAFHMIVNDNHNCKIHCKNNYSLHTDLEKDINKYQNVYFQLSNKKRTGVFIIHPFAQENLELQIKPKPIIFY